MLKAIEDRQFPEEVFPASNASILLPSSESIHKKFAINFKLETCKL